jgi:hypothetical protein
VVTEHGEVNVSIFFHGQKFHEISSLRRLKCGLQPVEAVLAAPPMRSAVRAAADVEEGLDARSVWRRPVPVEPQH